MSNSIRSGVELVDTATQQHLKDLVKLCETVDAAGYDRAEAVIASIPIEEETILGGGLND
jgi:hypothetical protein